MKQLATWIVHALESRGDEAKLAVIRTQVKDLCRTFPLYSS